VKGEGKGGRGYLRKTPDPTPNEKKEKRMTGRGGHGTPRGRRSRGKFNGMRKKQRNGGGRDLVAKKNRTAGGGAEKQNQVKQHPPPPASGELQEKKTEEKAAKERTIVRGLTPKKAGVGKKN